MLDLVESIFMRFGVRNLRYDGAMSREARDKAVRDFRQPGGPKVMLIRYGWDTYSALKVC